MAADENTQRGTGNIRTDQIGKVFVFVGKDVRKCLVCEQLPNAPQLRSAKDSATKCGHI
jgi:hypothetical protein